ncbi:MAG TPA: COX15/CtaA family protein [Mucilaginibacter sp.]|nr:COX15/CtaA family protein [Mucilaginibacter sp.]
MQERPFEHYSYSQRNKNNKAVICWLSIGACMLMVQVLLGGITRLTGSGLSITEWKPLMGALPPLNHSEWQHSFEKYQQIAQFKKVNSHFTLADYQAIFFWEWLHREWARLMGLVFLIPFIIFIVKGKIDRKMAGPLAVLFLLGGLQGAIGWLMVKSGLNDTDTRVDHIRLAVHFMCALFLLTYLVWFILKLRIPPGQVQREPKLKKLNIFLLSLLFFQLIYGAFMAGTHAALYAPSWPDINGVYIPAGMLANGNLWYNLNSDPLTIQFIHRMLAYTIAATIIIWFFKCAKTDRGSWLYTIRWLPPALVGTQIALGILALVNSPLKGSIYYSAAHQFNAMILLTSLVITLYLSNGRSYSE